MSAISTPGSGPKAMSSRLLTMKFMQRAAASPTTPSPSTDDTEPPSKRRRKNGESPTTPKVLFDEVTNQKTLLEAAALEDAKREAALEKLGVAAGDTRWVHPRGHRKASVDQGLALRVVQTGYAMLDAPSNIKADDEDDVEDKPVMVGRRSFGDFNKILEKKQDAESSSESDSEDSEEESDRDSDDPTAQLIKSSREEAARKFKEERKARKKAEQAESLELAKKRKKKEVSLNNLTSLSGRQEVVVKCYQCQGPHAIKDCPQRPGNGDKGKRPHQGGHGGGKSKKLKTSR